jgi:hypothetical protein
MPEGEGGKLGSAVYDSLSSGINNLPDSEDKKNLRSLLESLKKDAGTMRPGHIQDMVADLRNSIKEYSDKSAVTSGENIQMDVEKMRSVKMPKEIKSKGIDSKEYKQWIQENWAKDKGDKREITSQSGDIEEGINQYYTDIVTEFEGKDKVDKNKIAKIAKEKCKLPDIAKHLSWLNLDSNEGEEYWLCMNLAGDYASACHHKIHGKIKRRKPFFLCLDKKIIFYIFNYSFLRKKK